SIGCTSNDECNYDMTCVNLLCMDICYPGLCGENAECATSGHKPFCDCPPGTTGNPTIKCSALAIETPPLPPPPLAEYPPIAPADPLRPLAGEKITTPVPVMETTPRPTEQIILIGPPPVIVPIKVACENNDDCDTDNACINMLCIKSCGLGVCGKDSECLSRDHRPICLCPPGTTGDPRIKCSALITETKESPAPVAEHKIPLSDTPIVPIHGSSSPRPEATAVYPTVSTEPPEVIPVDVPLPPPITVGCETTTDCPFDNSCVNRLCMNIC
ncbi:hypothetical protein FHG87_016820, partial [Trinorchestia longiramus]